MGESWVALSSVIAGANIAPASFGNYFLSPLLPCVERYGNKLFSFLNPYIEIKFYEYSGINLKPSEAFSAIQNYLSENSSSHATRFNADVMEDSQSLILRMEEKQEVQDEFKGVKVWWVLNHNSPLTMQSVSRYAWVDEKRYYMLKFHKRHRELITGSYVKHVFDEGKAVALKKRLRKLYSNCKNTNGARKRKWSHVPFDHPATFDSLAMERKKKEAIKKDLKKYSEGKEYYAKIGKPWKREYLLYGPPGTGKSTMIAAIANFLNYDVYVLELATVMDNSELKNLLIGTTNKSVIVIEDSDCSLDLTGQRKKKKKKAADEEELIPFEEVLKEEKESRESKVTLSGLLNFIDGLWSDCGAERVIVFKTNYVDKLDPALIGRGRMDNYIEMSYCGFEAFKVLARNYLNIDSHEVFAEVGSLLSEINMTPADVARNLMSKSDEDDAETSLKNLIEALKAAKEEAVKKSEEETHLDAEKEKQDKFADSAKENGELDETPAKSVKGNGIIIKENKGEEI